MKYSTTTSKASRKAVDCVIVGIYKSDKLAAGANDIDSASDGRLEALIKSGDLSPELGRCTVLNDVKGVRATRVAVVGLGKNSSFGVKQFTKALTTALKSLEKSKCSDVLNTLTLEPVDDVGIYYRARHSLQTLHNVQYHFSEMKSGAKPKAPKLKEMIVAVENRTEASQARLGCEHGDAIGAGMSLAKDLGNLPANVCTPTYLAKRAEKMAREYDRLQTRILGRTEMKKLGMHSLLSVSAGSDQPPKLIVMQYKGGGKKAPIVLVGKGVTFDTGGISLKPGPAMDEMKYDMCGAAGVIATMAAVAQMQLPVNLTVIVPAVENMPNGSATKPGDIVKSMSGKTIEILNTDAEGRLILCDALTYARRFKPDAIIDVATLTGACVIALGRHRCAVMTRSDELADEVLAAGDASNDLAWRLPIDNEYAELLKSNFADFANIGGREGGALTAGCFLGKFTGGMNWAHLDIAGTAWVSGKQKGATGRPVPLLTEFVLDRCGALP